MWEAENNLKWDWQLTSSTAFHNETRKEKKTTKFSLKKMKCYAELSCLYWIECSKKKNVFECRVIHNTRTFTLTHVSLHIPKLFFLILPFVYIFTLYSSAIHVLLTLSRSRASLLCSFHIKIVGKKSKMRNKKMLSSYCTEQHILKLMDVNEYLAKAYVCELNT